jgi:tRNA dimethylallyltransferase
MPPLVVVLGCTGTGKSQLATDLAAALGGEVISADSIQVYKGLDIVSNKIPEAEQRGVPHHLLGFLHPAQLFSVREYADAAVRAAAEIHARGRLPVAVGGTHYYLEGLMFAGAGSTPPAPTAESEPESAGGLQASSAMPAPSEDPRELHRELERVDPIMARRLHPNDTRKVLRSLDVFRKYGVPHSTLLMAQGSPAPRYAPIVCFWVKSDLAVLDTRLDKRVDAMAAAGLLKELFDFHRDLHKDAPQTLLLADEGARTAANCGLDFTKGILQAIGFKEFAPLFALLHHHGWRDEALEDMAGIGAFLQGDDKAVGDARRVLGECVEDMKRATRRYARKQIAWVQNRLLRGAKVEGDTYIHTHTHPHPTPRRVPRCFCVRSGHD